MRLDRVADDIYVFVSDLYIQVVSTVLLTDDGAVVVDTLAFPSETREVLAFIEGKLGTNAVRYVVNTHHHADHVYGNYLFESADVVAHERTRDLLQRYGPARLAQARRETPALAQVHLRLPDITYEKEMYLHVGHRQLRLFHAPGHTPDGTSVLVMGDKALIAGDALLPVPHIVGGNIEQLRATLRAFKALRPSFIVQGHGEVLLRGEVDEMIDSSLNYLSSVVSQVEALVARGDPPARLRAIDIESCGLSRIPLDGMVNKLHAENVLMLYKRAVQAQGRSGEPNA